MSVSSHPDMILWEERVKEWYPNLHQQTYFLPPIFMHRTQHHEEEVSGRAVYVTDPPTTVPPQPGDLALSDVREDRAHQRVVSCLQQLSQREVMFVISQLQFGDYLSHPAYAATASLFPRSRDPDLKAQQKHRGDFDILILLRHYGILTGEIKAVGDNFTDQDKTEQELDNILVSKVKRAIKQLNKSSDVLSHLVSIYKTQPKIRTTLMLPNITTKQLKRVVEATSQLRQDLCKCLGLSGSHDPIPFCLTLDVLSDPVPWWQQLLKEIGPDPAMTDLVYLDLVSWFGGPATTVTVFCSTIPRLARAHHEDLRSPGEGVEETACRFAPVDIVLHPSQVAAVNSQEPLVFLTGPPGTGKSIVLLLKATDWLRRGKPVHIVSCWKGSLAASHSLASQLKQSSDPGPAQMVHIHTFYLNEGGLQVIQTAVQKLRSVAENGELFVIVDEATSYFHHKRLTEFCTKLHQQIQGLHLWVASQYYTYKPPLLTSIVLTEPLRTPPSVTRLVQQSDYMGRRNLVHTYTAVSSPLPAHGPDPRVVQHAGQGHSRGKPNDCEQCGREIASQLEELRVGGTATGRGSSSPEPLHYRDVFILTWSSFLHDAERGDSGHVTRQPSGLLRGVRERRIPFRVLKSGDEDAIKDVATMAGPDQVVVAFSGDVQGLERKVVVFIQEDPRGLGDEEEGKLMALSRCTSQLVWVTPPP